MNMISFEIPGPPVAKGRARSFAKNGRIGHYTPDATVRYERLVGLLAAREMRGCEPFDCACELIINLFVQVPKSWSNKRRLDALGGAIIPTIKPDCSNVLKAIEDGLNGIVWKDDSQASDIIVRRRYSDAPRVMVMVKTRGSGDE